jgi:glycerophosphoryl diester phosphodiesterase
MDVVAHRGLWAAAPENSLGAVSAAVRAGFRLVEVDVRASADGVPFLLHDLRLERTTSAAGRLSTLAAAQARRALLADGSPLPRLDEALEIVRGRAVLCLDVKSCAILPALERMLRPGDPDVEIWSESDALVRFAAERGIAATLICTGLLRRGIGAFLWRAWEAGATGVSFYPADLEVHVAAACRNAGMPFLCGTPNDERTWRFLLDQGARAAITDRPLECRGWLNAVAGAVR